MNGIAEHLFIRLAPELEDCESIVVDRDGRVVEPLQRHPLPVAAQRAARRRVTVLVPGVDVATSQVEIPAVSRRRLRQLLPFSMEETVAADVDSLHFALGVRGHAEAPLSVSAVARSRLENWLEVLAASGVEADAVCAETEGVPDTPSTLNLMVDGRRIFGRRAGKPAFTFDGLSLPTVFEMLTTQAEDDEARDLRRVYVYIAGDTTVDVAQDIETLRSRVTSLDVRTLERGLTPKLAAYLVTNPGINLLQGAYRRSPDWAAWLRPWRSAAALVLILIGATLAVDGAEYWMLRQRDQAMTELLSAQCNGVFSLQRLSACAAEARRRLSEAGAETSGGSGRFLAALAAVADHKEADFLIEALSYRNEVLDLRIVLPSVADLDRFSQGIASDARFEVRVESTTPGEDGIESRLQIVENDP